MSRRYRNLSFKMTTDRSSIGEAHVDRAVDTISKQCKQTIATMLSYTKTVEQTVDMLFEPTTIERSRTAHGVVIEPHNRVVYQVGDKVSISLSYEDTKLLPIRKDVVRYQAHLYGELEQYIKDVWAIHHKFEEVKAVLKWLNRNATPGAVRYYWPTAMKLCPESTIWRDLQDVPSRYNEPKDVRVWTQAMKDAANTMAAAELLPKDTDTPDPGAMHLTFSEVDVNPDPTFSEVKYRTQQMTYYI